MKYVCAGGKILLSLERGEELCGTLKMLAAEEDIKFALVSAHGQCSRVTLGSLDTRTGRVGRVDYSEPDGMELACASGELTGGDTARVNLHAVIGSAFLHDEYGGRFRDRNSGVAYAGTLERAEAGAGLTAVVEPLDVDARLADVPAPEQSGGVLDRIGSAFSKTGVSDRLYRKLELE